jgi:hypothetical protein
MSVTGTIVVDLTAVRDGRLRSRVHVALANAPEFAAVELVVGHLIVDVFALEMIRELIERKSLSVNVKGEVDGLRRWVSAIRTGEIEGVLFVDRSAS